MNRGNRLWAALFLTAGVLCLIAIYFLPAPQEKKKDDGCCCAACKGGGLRIINVLGAEPVQGRDAVNAVLLFDQEVANDHALLVVDLGQGKEVRLEVWPVSEDMDGKPLPLGKPTTRLEVQWSPGRDGISEKHLISRPAKLLPPP